MKHKMVLCTMIRKAQQPEGQPPLSRVTICRHHSR